ncbi:MULTISPECIES: hypothetical protein [Actinocorallia]|uniref:Uncharacterized protein n=2 Tax=Actinocorallia TaxID=58108 RepID=A0ABP6H086_9ACTN
MTTTTDTLDLAAIRRAISDPGAVLPRDLGDDFQPAESVSNWSARAVLAVLTPKVEEMQAEIERLRQKDRDALAWEARLAGHAWTAVDGGNALGDEILQLRKRLAAQEALAQVYRLNLEELAAIATGNSTDAEARQQFLARLTAPAKEN